MPVIMRLVLIDGRVIARLMVDFNIGSRSESYVIKADRRRLLRRGRLSGLQASIIVQAYTKQNRLIRQSGPGPQEADRMMCLTRQISIVTVAPGHRLLLSVRYNVRGRAPSLV